MRLYDRCTSTLRLRGICHPLRVRQPIQTVLSKCTTHWHIGVLKCFFCLTHTKLYQFDKHSKVRTIIAVSGEYVFVI